MQCKWNSMGFHLQPIGSLSACKNTATTSVTNSTHRDSVTSYIVVNFRLVAGLLYDAIKLLL